MTEIDMQFITIQNFKLLIEHTEIIKKSLMTVPTARAKMNQHNFMLDKLTKHH